MTDIAKGTIKDKNLILLEDMSINTSIVILEEASNHDELIEIAKKAGIHYPSKDLAIFKCIYALTDTRNRNGAILPKEEVEKALDTINGKAVDIDHVRRRTVGTWLHAKLEGNKIIAYGSFWKQNYPEEYEDFQTRLTQGKIKISFEAWVKQEETESASYICRDIVFAGGAILDIEDPAEPSAEILQFANRINSNHLIQGRFYTWEFEQIINLVHKVDGDFTDILLVDFENSLVKARSWTEEKIATIILTPTIKSVKSDKKIKAIHIEDAKKLSYKERKQLKDNDFALIQYKKDKAGKKIKIRRFPIHDKAHVRNALARLPQAKNLTKAEKKIILKKVISKAKKFGMKNITKKYSKGGNAMGNVDVKELQKRIAELEVALETKEKDLKAKDEELLKTKEELASTIEAKSNAETELATVKEALDKKIEESNAKVIEQRKSNLGDFAKDLSDDDLLDDMKYKIAMKDKEIAELKQGKQVDTKADLTKGSNEDTDSQDDLSARVRRIAFAKSE